VINKLGSGVRAMLGGHVYTSQIISGSYPSAAGGSMASPGGVQSPFALMLSTSPKQSAIELPTCEPFVFTVNVPMSAAQTQFSGEVEVSEVVHVGSAEKVTVTVTGEPSELMVTL